MPSAIATVAAGAITLLILLQLLLRYVHDPKEPPIAPTAIPFIGHVIGLSRKKSKYYVELRDKYNLPIYTIHMPGARMYVINSVSLIPAVQKNFKTLAFPPIEASMAKNVCGTSKVANDALDANVNGDDPDAPSYSMSHYPAVRKPLAPGPDLDAMNRVMVEKVGKQIEAMSTVRRMGLFEFTNHEITMATTDSVYGPQNPFRDPKVAASFWKFGPGIMILIMQLFPSLLAKESLAARALMTDAFLRYFNNGGHLEGSGLIKARVEHSREYDVPFEDIARFECGGALAILSNTTPSAFWMAYHIYSDEKLLKSCRDELAKILSDSSTTTTTKDGPKQDTRTLDMTKVKTSCPILLSTFQEVLRVHTVGISTRLVMQDHMLDGQYLLKKGSTLLIPGPVQHTSHSAFGPTADTFDHRRFLAGERRHNPTAFRGFGGGTTLCPGRHFATTEILAFTALLILRCDVKPVDGKWTCPTTNDAGMWETTPRPDSDIQVIISPRSDVDKQFKLNVLLTESDKGISFANEEGDG